MISQIFEAMQMILVYVLAAMGVMILLLGCYFLIVFFYHLIKALIKGNP